MLSINKQKLLALALLFLSIGIVGVHAQPSSWQKTKAQGNGKITMYWHGSEPFIFLGADGSLTGIEYDVFNGFATYLKNTQNIDLAIEWKKAKSFNNTFELIKNETQPGYFGCSAFSITDQRKKEVAFSTPYLSDIAVLISSKNVPFVANENDFKDKFNNLTAITIKGTTYEKYLLKIKEQLHLNFKTEYIASSDNILKTITKRENTFGYIDLPIYLTRLKKDLNLNVIRQNVFPIKSEGYGFIMPKGSDWIEPFNEYLESAYFSSISSELIGGYLQQDIYRLIKSISSGKQVNPEEEIMLLTKEKELQYKDMLEKALADQKNKTLTNAIIAAFIIAVLGLIILYKVYIDKARANQALEAQKNRIEEQQENIEQQKKAIEERNKELLHLNEEKNNLINILAHDLRTPINQISGLIHLHTLQNPNLNQDDKKTFDTIELAIKHLNELIAKILNVEAIEARQSNIKLEKIDLAPLLNQIHQEFTEKAKEKGITLEISNSKNIDVLGDATYLHQILDNLLSNALKFSYSGTKVVLTVASNGGKAIIKITDQGPGFTQQDLNKLFGKFQRLSAKPTAGEPSIGLGLSIVKKYVDLLNGTIKCNSEMGKGAEFTIELPLA